MKLRQCAEGRSGCGFGLISEEVDEGPSVSFLFIFSRIGKGEPSRGKNVTTFFFPLNLNILWK